MVLNRTQASNREKDTKIDLLQKRFFLVFDVKQFKSSSTVANMLVLIEKLSLFYFVH